jgi:hypothetical protein
MAGDNLDDLRTRAEGALRRLNVNPSAANLATAKGLIEALRNMCDYPTIGRLVEAVSRADPRDPTNPRFYAQYLIEDGKATAAADILKALTRRLPRDHPEHAEGPPGGKRQTPGVSRVHYRAPTEGGSSGSRVFNADLWQVIALHHKGGKSGLQKLNDKPGTYAANEGISIQSIRDAVIAG